MTQQYGNQAAEIKKQSFFSRLAKDLKKYKGLYPLALPVFIYYAVFVITPLLGNVIAFQDYSLTKGILGSKFVGLKHFTDFVTSMNFGRVVKKHACNQYYIAYLRLSGTYNSCAAYT